MEPETKVDDFLGDLQEEKLVDDDPFQTTEQKEKEEELGVDPEPEKIPFHKDPKVQRYIEKEIEKRLPKEKPVVEEFKPSNEDFEEVLTRVIGNDTPERQAAIKDWLRTQSAREEKIIERARSLWQQEQQQIAEEEKAAEDELIQGFENIEDTFSVDITGSSPSARKLRAEFVDFIEKVAPKDSNGDIIEYPDFEQTFEIFQERAPKPSNSKAKDLASRGAARSETAETTKVDSPMNWDEVERAFNKMTE